MEKEEGNTDIESCKYFECHQCKSKYKYDNYNKYKDKKANLYMMEDVYYIKDPFEPVHNIPLILGGTCSVCSNVVCVNPKCSLFYTRRFCTECVQNEATNFPEELKK